MKRSLLAIGFAYLLTLNQGEARAQSDLRWADGIGMMPCRELPSIPNESLNQWIRGYWTGANLYLGGSDLCLERASIVDVEASEIRPMLRIHCARMQDHPIMFAALNALKGLPTVTGSRAAACGLPE